jgi:hypothetical protein
VQSLYRKEQLLVPPEVIESIAIARIGISTRSDQKLYGPSSTVGGKYGLTGTE